MANAMQNIGACVFDAYGTLFDVAAAAAHCQDDLGGKADALTQIWRTRQLEYSWLRSLMDEYVEFWQITGDALDGVGVRLDRCEPVWKSTSASGARHRAGIASMAWRTTR